MDLIFILIGMAVGGIVGVGMADVIASHSIELRFALGTLGAMVGCGGGYFMAWLIELPAKTAQPAAKRTQAFRPQIVGSRCALCEERIIVVVDADFCPRCGRVFCKQCVRQMPCPQCRTEASYVEPEIVEAVIVVEEPTKPQDAPEGASANQPDEIEIFLADDSDHEDDIAT